MEEPDHLHSNANSPPNNTNGNAAERRALAVAKLKRAASLPRMKDGRRPPMHVDGFSEGEKPEVGGSGSNSGAGTPSPTPPGGEGEDETVRMRRGDGPVPAAGGSTAERHLEPEPPREAAVDREPEPSREAAVDLSYSPAPQRSYDTDTPDRSLTSPSPGPSNRRRRSRSRSRSRTSKDLKRAQAQGLLPRFGGDSSADEAPPTPARALSPFLLHPLPVSPTPRFLSPESGFGGGLGLNTTNVNLSSNLPFNAPSPSLSGPSSPVIGGGGGILPRPTLSDIQASLKRSNSAGRSLAMRALTGGTEDYTPSPSPTPDVGRNNTVSGGERSAARKMQIGRAHV